MLIYPIVENNGFGEHIWDTDFDVVPKLLYWCKTLQILNRSLALILVVYITQALYVMTIGSVKISLLFFYLNVFPRKSFRIACYSIMGLVFVSIATFTLVGIFQCAPISRAWRLDSPGKCLNYNAVAWANASMNIVQDLIIIALPIRELRSLQIAPRKMNQLYLMFGVGSL